MPNWKSLVAWTLARLDEPSTYAGLAAIMASAGFHLNANLVTTATQAAVGLAGLGAVLLSEKKS